VPEIPSSKTRIRTFRSLKNIVRFRKFRTPQHEFSFIAEMIRLINRSLF